MSCRSPLWHSAVLGTVLLGFGLASSLVTQAQATSSSTGHSQGMIDLVAKAIPTVVNIVAHRVDVPKDPAQAQSAAFTRVRESVGSGFVVDPSGFIATNRHVVDGAYQIDVTFSDGRSAQAKLIFKSTVVDVAFLQVDVGQPLPAAVLAANQKVQIGERVFAIGNPLGLGMSVSAGIVSAMDRNIKESPYDAFIQTDAAINHGSSGGPLFNEAGEVVGINTALYTSVSNGGSEGLGFAIPGRDIRFLISQLKLYGRIRAGWLGVNAQKLTPEMAAALGFPDAYGTIVASVLPNSPGMAAGIQSGDVIETVDGEPMVDATTLYRAAALSLGKTVELKVWREGKSFTVSTTIVESEESHGMREAAMAIHAPRFASLDDMGLRLAPITDDMRLKYRLHDDIKGLAVTEVARESVAQEAGLRAGDVIVRAKTAAVETVDLLDKQIMSDVLGGRRQMILLVQSMGGVRWVALPLRP